MKQHTIVMLATKQASSDSQLFIINKKLELGTLVKGIKSISNCVAQELYVLSDDKIKEGDHILVNGNPEQVMEIQQLEEINYHTKTAWFTNCKKIIATSDKILVKEIWSSNGEFLMAESNYPQIPKEFIQEYIDVYNSGKPITEVMVEYEQKPKIITNPNCQLCEGLGIYDWGDCVIGKCTSCYSELTLKERESAKYDNFEPKVNSSNEISISKVEDKLYTKEEVTILLKSLDKHIKQYNHYFEGINNFIKENL